MGSKNTGHSIEGEEKTAAHAFWETRSWQCSTLEIIDFHGAELPSKSKRQEMGSPHPSGGPISVQQNPYKIKANAGLAEPIRRERFALAGKETAARHDYLLLSLV